MGYTFQGFIGEPEVLEAAAARFQHVKLIPLTESLSTIPLGEELEQEINQGESQLLELWDILTDRIEAVGLGLSQYGRLAYVEADYFGGTGDQGCVVWEKGQELLREVRADKAINHALKLLGVQTVEGFVDEFDTVDMGRHRRVESWFTK
ncbi:hypothetical protein B9G55_22635 [Saccharibacillus sp. O16]|nr:hypothetical protein B9G55_22635 [Saccharibacillus sp. O16]